jgi:hypothetical protein
MGARSGTTMNVSTALRLGRVSNLPTVWSNVLAGVALSGGSTWDPRVVPLMFAVSLFYMAGMFFNDVFDAEIDALERPSRPIPRHEVTAQSVSTVGGILLLGGLVILAGIGYVTPAGTGPRPVVAGVILCGLILLYDWYHKHNPFSPLIMGACRMMVYITAAFAVLTHPSTEVFWGGLVLVSWLIGLTYIAKQETLNQVTNLWPLGFLAVPFVYTFSYAVDDAWIAAVWCGLFGIVLSVLYLIRRRQPGDVSRAVGTLIAGISLLDAVFILQWGEHRSGLLAIAAFPLTLLLQRVIPGT